MEHLYNPCNSAVANEGAVGEKKGKCSAVQLNDAIKAQKMRQAQEIMNGPQDER